MALRHPGCLRTLCAPSVVLLSRIALVFCFCFFLSLFFCLIFKNKTILGKNLNSIRTKKVVPGMVTQACKARIGGWGGEAGELAWATMCANIQQRSESSIKARAWL